MNTYKFNYNDKIYELGEENFNGLINDDENPVIGFEVSDILDLLNQHDEVDFNMEYYKQPCENCLWGKEEKAKYFNFLEYHFYIFTKDGEYVISNISKEYENTSFKRLLNAKRVDNSYIVSVMVCANCGDYSVDIEEVTV